MQLAPQQLIRLGVSPANAAIYAPLLNAAFVEFEINTPLRQQHSLAQWLHESINFSKGTESLNYTPQALISTFNNKRNNPLSAELSAKLGRVGNKPADQVRIGNIAYANRLGNGPESSGDGYRFRGRSITQLTGRDHYRNYGKRLGLDLEKKPELAALPANSVRIAGAFWLDNGLNEIADKDDAVAITKRLNGGLNGIDSRLALLTRCRHVLAGPVAV